MGRAQADECEELGRELGQMGQGCTDNQTAHRVPNEADLAYARDGTEGKNVLFDLCCESFAHFHDVALCMVLVAL